MQGWIERGCITVDNVPTVPLCKVTKQSQTAPLWFQRHDRFSVILGLSVLIWRYVSIAHCSVWCQLRYLNSNQHRWTRMLPQLSSMFGTICPFLWAMPCLVGVLLLILLSGNHQERQRSSAPLVHCVCARRLVISLQECEAKFFSPRQAILDLSFKTKESLLLLTHVGCIREPQWPNMWHRREMWARPGQRLYQQFLPPSPNTHWLPLRESKQVGQRLHQLWGFDTNSKPDLMPFASFGEKSFISLALDIFLSCLSCNMGLLFWLLPLEILSRLGATSLKKTKQTNPQAL